MYDSKLALNCTIYASALSPCKQYLVVGNNYGYLSLFNIAKLVTSNADGGRPSLTFKAHEGEVYSLCTINKLLISGGAGGMNVWTWKSLIAGKPGKKSWLKQPVKSGAGPYITDDVNCVSGDVLTSVVAGKDDGVIDLWDISKEKCVLSLSGHEDYIHDVFTMNGNNILSASEDGCVKMWDVRTGTVCHNLEPHTNASVARPENGKWMSCVCSDSNSEWVVCGGGPKLSLWHTRSWNLVTEMECDDFTPSVCKYYKDMIIAGGNKDNLLHYNVNGAQRAKIPCSIGNVFSICFDKNYSNAASPLIATGASFKIDIFNNPQYKAMSLWQVE